MRVYYVFEIYLDIVNFRNFFTDDLSFFRFGIL